LNLGWELLGRLPKEELDRVDTKILDKYYHPTKRDEGVTTSASPGSIANM
ncbi:MAG TPA: V-type ATP synthase subunit B, partial [Lachnoclostridium phocaeense]|nr:V-type ATP synthase subunit B [Lachnoclostridium phocaeense]